MDKNYKDFHIKNEKNNNEKISNKTKQIRAMSITGCFLAVAILVSFATNFIKITFLGDFLTLDLSLVFIIPLIFICNIFWGAFAAIVCGLALFIWSGSGSWIGPIFTIVMNLIIVFLIYSTYFILFKKIKKTSIRIFLSLAISLPILILIACLMNGILFTPLYWWFFGAIKTPSFIEAEKWYNKEPGPYLLYINTYWNGIFGLYSAFNVFKFGIIFIIIYTPLLLMIKNQVAEKYFYKIKK